MQEHNQRNKNKQRYRLHRNRILLAMGYLLVTAAAAGGIAIFGFPAPVQVQMDTQPDKRAVSGSLHNRESRGIDKDNFRVVLSQLPTVSEGSRKCNIEYENPDSNYYSIRVNLYLTESGQLLGSICHVSPGDCVKVIQVNQMLEAGEYPLTVRIESFEETIPSGTMMLEMTLRIIKPQSATNSRRMLP